MKKWLTGCCILILLLIAAEYILIPSDLTVSKVELVQCNVNSANKYIGDQRQWANWWPGWDRWVRAAGTGQNAETSRLARTGEDFNTSRPAITDRVYGYRGMEYRMPGMYSHLMEVQIVTPDSTIHSRIGVVGFADNRDSSALQWEFHLVASWNPIVRFRQYREAGKLRADMTGILAALRAFLDDKEKVYGIRIQEVSTADSFLIAIRSVYPVRPGTADMSALMHRLKKIIAANRALETGNPMVNVTPAAPGQFEAMVAIPTNKELKGDKEVFSRKLVRGKYLMTEVRGGDYTVNKALEHLQEYMNDYQRTTMAIPFQSWVTDRSAERDTAKWVTRIYYPVY